MVEFNIFESACFVVTIKTNSRIYGDIGQQFVRRYPGFAIPDVVYGKSEGPFPLPDGRKVIFACLWKDKERDLGYEPRIVSGCTGSAILKAAFDGCEEIALPLIGGGQKERMKPFMGKGIDEARQALERKQGEEIEDIGDVIDVIIAVLPKQMK